MNPEDLAAELKRLRETLDISQEEMARKYVVTLRTYQRWESGQGVRERYLKLARTWAKGKKKKSGA